MKNILTLLIFLFGMVSCNPGTPDYAHLSWQGESGIRMVVEIPAGTHVKQEWDPTQGRILPAQENGTDRVIDFLPYPGNYGFIPGTMMDRQRGGDGDALDILVIGSHQPKGTVLEIIPLGMLEMKDRGEIDTKIIGVPADPKARVIRATNFQEFLIEYDAAKRIIEEWFLHYKGYGVMEMVGWQDEKAARSYIQKWSKAAQ